MIELFFLDAGDDDMYRDTAPHLPKIVILHPPEELMEFQKQIEELEFLGIDIEAAMADMLDHFRNKDDAGYNLSLSNYEMCNEHEGSELHADVERYSLARQNFGVKLLKQIIEHGLYVNGILHYQLKQLNRAMLVLEKLQVPLTDDELRRRAIARQADIASRRYVPRTHD